MLNINDISFDTNDQYTFAIYKGTYYKINSTVKQIIERLQNGESVASISEDLSVSKEDIQNLLDLFSAKKHRYIHRIFTIVPVAVCNFFASFLHPLFANSRLILSVTALYVAIQVWHCVRVPFLFYSPAIPVLYYTLIPLLIILWHELGHLTAAYRYKITNMKIGLGTFLIFPTLYVNMNPIQVLSSTKRIIIDFGGLYFQMLLGIFLIILYQFFPSDFLNITICGNLFGILYNLIPYRISDGHWIYSDFFQIDNLNVKVNQIWRILFSRHIPQFKEKKIPILLYFLWNSVFMITLYYEMVRILYNNTFQIVPTFRMLQEQTLSFSLIYNTLMLLLPYFLFSYIIFQMTRGLIKKQ